MKCHNDKPDLWFLPAEAGWRLQEMESNVVLQVWEDRKTRQIVTQTQAESSKT